MENIELTNEENIIITENGFYVKRILSPYDYFTTLFSHLAFYNIFIFIVLFLYSLFASKLPVNIEDAIFSLIKV